MKKMNIKNLIEILEFSRNSIENNKERYICYAIYFQRKGYVDERQYLINWISDMLDNKRTLDSWLFHKHNIPYGIPYAFRNNMLEEKIRQTRLNWIDWMINQLKQEELS